MLEKEALPGKHRLRTSTAHRFAVAALVKGVNHGMLVPVMRSRVVILLLSVAACLVAQEPAPNPLITSRLSGPQALTDQIKKVSELIAKGALDDALSITRSVLEDPMSTAEQKGHALYAKGLILLKKEQWKDAFAAFTDAAEMKGIPGQLRAVAYMEIARLHLREDRKEAALKALTTAIEVPDSPSLVTVDLIGMRANLLDGMGREAEATADYKLIADEKSLPQPIRVQALTRRSGEHEKKGDLAKAVADCTTIIELKPTPAPDVLALAYINRSHYHLAMGDFARAVADATEVLELQPPASPARRMLAHYNRAGARDKAGDAAGAVRDYQDMLKIPGLPVRERSLARMHLGELLTRAGKTDEGLRMLNDIIGDEDVPAAMLGHASVMRGSVLARAGKSDAAMEDFQRALLISSTPADQRGMALLNRGTLHLQAGRRDPAIKDFQAVTKDKTCPPDRRAAAWLKLAELHRDLKKIDEAISDVTKGLALTGTSPAQRAVLLRQRVLLQESQSQYAKAVADMDEVVRLPLPLESRMLDLLYRAKLLSLDKRYDEMVADLTTIIGTKDAPTKYVAEALRLRASFYEAAKEPEKAKADRDHRARLSP